MPTRKKNRVKKIIWVSSSTTYQSYNKKIKEKDLDLNKNPYDIYYGIGWTYRYLEKIFNYLNDKNRLILNREHVLKNVGIKNFSTHLLSIIKNIF